MKEYPKLVAILIALQSNSAVKIYAIEDENCFIGYAKGVDNEKCGIPLLYFHHFDAALGRWGNIWGFPPKGDEDVDALYKEIHDIMENDNRHDYKMGYEDFVEHKYEKTRGGHISDPNNLQTDGEKEAFKYY